jgi:hypothetical protein
MVKKNISLQERGNHSHSTSFIIELVSCMLRYVYLTSHIHCIGEF